MQTSYKEYLQARELLKEDIAGTDLLEAFILCACDYSASTCMGKNDVAVKNSLTEALSSLNEHCKNNYGFNPIQLHEASELDTFNNWIAEMINTIFKNRVK